MMKAEWLDILYRVKAGELSVDEAARRLETLEVKTPPQNGQLPVEVIQPPDTAESFNPDLGWWKNAWMVPVWVGTGIFALAAVLMAWGYNNGRFFWFYCAWLPLLLGLAVIILGAWSQQARWAHVRVQGADGTRVAISVPIPLRLSAWALRIFGQRLPQEMHNVDLPAVLDALGGSRDPISVEVDEKDGDRVRVYII